MTAQLTVQRPKRTPEGKIVRDEHGDIVLDTLSIIVELGDAHRLIDPDTGEPAPAESVMRLRQAEFDRVMELHAPTPRRIMLEDLADESAPAEPENARIGDRIIHARHLVRSAEAALRAVRAGRMEATEPRLNAWWEQALALSHLARRPDLTAEEAQALEELAKQLAAIVQALRGEL